MGVCGAVARDRDRVAVVVVQPRSLRELSCERDVESQAADVEPGRRGRCGGAGDCQPHHEREQRVTEGTEEHWAP